MTGGDLGLSTFDQVSFAWSGEGLKTLTLFCIEQSSLAGAKGFNAICNLRLETADVGGSTLSKKSAITVSISASATAYTADR
jgi:hypothetical protein